MPNTAQILLVEPHDASRTRLHALAGVLGDVESCATFEAARARILASPVDLLVTNIRLGAFNGLHLVYLSRSSESAAPRAIVYSDGLDIGLAREVQRAGAFYEEAESLPASLAAHLDSALPWSDRRDPAAGDRGTARRVRIGRRGSDVCMDDATSRRANPGVERRAVLPR